MPRIPGAGRIAAFAVLLAACAMSPAAAQDPAHTPTLFIHGYEDNGAAAHGGFGLDLHIPQMDSIAALGGLPVVDSGAVWLPANVLTATTYYGAVPPPSYDAARRAELDSVTAAWGGGVPRYALIVANYVEDILRRTHADRVNLVSASFGSLVVRWMIEKDVGHLASEGRIARWLTIEGLIAGNWAASRTDLVPFLDLVDPQPIDVTHMQYDWVSANLHAPRGELDDPDAAKILVGQMVSTNDDYNHAALSALMRTYDAWQSNDGVQAAADAVFSAVTARSRYLDRLPTLQWFPTDHLATKNFRGAWAAAACFVTQRRRVTVTLASARVADLHEPELPFFDLRPAEVVFESRVYSPRVATRWGIGDPLSTRTRASAAAPLYRFDHDGDTKAVEQVLFDGFVPDDETTLHLELGGAEVDYDWRYGVYETAQLPYFDELGATALDVSAIAPGSYPFTAASWSGTIRVDVFEYPFAATTAVPTPPVATVPAALRVEPNPHAGATVVRLAGAAARGGAWQLEIFDTSGRRVRRLAGDAASGIRWDGRDERGVALPAGVYLHRLAGDGRVLQGRSLLVR